MIITAVVKVTASKIDEGRAGIREVAAAVGAAKKVANAKEKAEIPAGIGIETGIGLETGTDAVKAGRMTEVVAGDQVVEGKETEETEAAVGIDVEERGAKVETERGTERIKGRRKAAAALR